MSSSTNDEVNLRDLLSLSRNRAQHESRSNKIQSLSDGELAQLISLATKREFSRGGLEDILLVILDVIARDAGNASEGPNDRAEDVKVKLEEFTDDFDSIALKAEEPRSPAAPLSTAIAALEQSIKRDSDKLDDSYATVKRTRREDDAFTGSSVVQPEISARPLSLKATGHIILSPSVLEPMSYLDPRAWDPELRACCVDIGKDPDLITPFFTKDKMGFYVPRDALPTESNNDEPESQPVMPLDLSIQVWRKIGAEYLQGWKSLERYSDMIMYQAQYFDTSSHCLSDFSIRRKRGPSTRVHSQGKMESACDFCIDTQRLCLRMIKVNRHETAKVIFPLPPHLRVGKHWTEMGFWVRENTEAVGEETTP